MNDQTDSQLLHAYAKHRSEAAFAELVRRHVDFVYSAALRMVSDSHVAEDVTQNVFVALAERANKLLNHPVLSGWLHCTAQNIAAQTVRTDVRRRAREQEAAAMKELLATESDANWKHIAPHLDAALGELSQPDRDALLLRYFERKSAHEMAQVLGVSDEAAQKRVSRAVERLREFFAKRGVTVGASGLIVFLSANAVQAAPVGLAVTISTAVTTVTIITHTTMHWINLKSVAAIVAAAIAAGTGTHLVQQRETDRLRIESKNMASQQENLTIERDKALFALKKKNDEVEQFQKDKIELLQLRGVVGVLRRQLQDLSKLRAENDRFRLELAKISTTADALETQKQEEKRAATQKIEDLGRWGYALIIYADNHKDQWPENIADAVAFLEQPNSIDLNRFEYINPGLRTEIKVAYRTIVMREKESWITSTGRPHRGYVFADGHVELHTESDDAGFSQWEHGLR